MTIRLLRWTILGTISGVGWLGLSLSALALLVTPSVAVADCAGGDCIPGGGSEATDCYAEFFGTGLVLNFPSFDPTRPKPKPKKEIRCFDGDAGCDSDGIVNGACVFNVDICLFNTDPNLPTCAPAEVTSVTVTAKKAPAEEAALQSAVNALLPASSSACTSVQSITVPIKSDRLWQAAERQRQSEGQDVHCGR